jgi:hypothetical protein
MLYHRFRQADLTGARATFMKQQACSADIAVAFSAAASQFVTAIGRGGMLVRPLRRGANLKCKDLAVKRVI